MVASLRLTGPTCTQMVLFGSAEWRKSRSHYLSVMSNIRLFFCCCFFFGGGVGGRPGFNLYL